MNAARISSYFGRLALFLIFPSATALAAQSAEVEDAASLEADIDAAPTEVPTRRVLEDSYRYHRLGELPEKASHLPTAGDGGSYRYGFPMQTHRWGWFGAEHYYPRVLWHRGYYGDRCRWSYRRGY